MQYEESSEQVLAQLPDPWRALFESGPEGEFVAPQSD
jgi:hypothetical protein